MVSDQPLRREAGSEATSKSDLVVWLTAQLDHDEQVARAAVAEDGPDWTAETYDVGAWNASGLVHGGGDREDRGALWDNEGSDSLSMKAATAVHVALHDPARVLRQVAAFRIIMDEHQRRISEPEICDRCEGIGDHAKFPCPTMIALVNIYSDRPGYDPAWAPLYWVES